MLTNLIYKGTDNKYFQFCGPFSLFPSYSAPSMWPESSHSQCVIEWAWLCSSRILSAKIGIRQDLVIVCWYLLITDFRARSPFRIWLVRKKGMRGREKLSTFPFSHADQSNLTLICFVHIVEWDFICANGHKVWKHLIYMFSEFYSRYESVIFLNLVTVCFDPSLCQRRKTIAHFWSYHFHKLQWFPWATP